MEYECQLSRNINLIFPTIHVSFLCEYSSTPKILCSGMIVQFFTCMFIKCRHFELIGNQPNQFWCVFQLIIYIKNFFHSDWLRAFFLTLQKRVISLQKEVTNQALWLVNDQRQWNILLSNEAHALDGAIDGVIFPWLCDTCAFLLLNHLEIFFIYVINK